MQEPSPNEIVAVIDIGSSAVRLVVAELHPDGSFRELEQLEQPLSLGRDVFRRGRVRRKTLGRLLSVLQDFQRVLDLYDIHRVRAIATAALREASNRDAVLDQLHLRHGIDVEVIGPAFEKHLIYVGVRAELADSFDLGEGATLVVEVGGGSTELTMLNRGEIVASQTLPLGSLRLQEIVPSSQGSPSEVLRLRRRHVRQAVGRTAQTLPLDRVDLFIAVGGEVRFVVDQRQLDHPGGHGVLDAQDFRSFVKRVRSRSPDTIATKLGMPWPKAEAFVPGLLVYDYLLRRTRSSRVVVPMANLRTGILRELAAEAAGQRSGELAGLVRTSAINLGRKFHFDEQHALQVARLSLSLFDQLGALHRMGSRERLLLESSAILHDVGTFVDHIDHDRHGEYLVSASEVFGLGRREHAVVTSVVRHHRQGEPDTKDPGFGSMSRKERLRVLRLLSLLRIADVLDRRGQGVVEQVEVRQTTKRLVLRVHPRVDLYFERAAFPEKASLFGDIFGIPVELAQE